ncbi:peptidase dimerization domain-containing protein [Streptomyces sp. NPDC055025]
MTARLRAGRCFATRPVIAKALAPFGVPVVLSGIGRLSVSGASGHSGSRHPTTGATSRAAHLIHTLDSIPLPPPAPGDPFPLPPKISVTACHSGEGFSVVPHLCVLNIDIRLTPAFGEADARSLLHDVTRTLDRDMPGPRPTVIEVVAAWPPFQLQPGQEPAAAPLHAAKESGLDPRAKTAGPSNIANLLASQGNIAATAGFGVPYEGLHGLDERAHLAELPQVYAVYHQAVLDLLHPALTSQIRPTLAPNNSPVASLSASPQARSHGIRQPRPYPGGWPDSRCHLRCRVRASRTAVMALRSCSRRRCGR